MEVKMADDITLKYGSMRVMPIHFFFYLKNHHIHFLNKENTFVVLYELTIGISTYIKNNKTIILHVNIKSTYKLLKFLLFYSGQLFERVNDVILMQ